MGNSGFIPVPASGCRHRHLLLLSSQRAAIPLEAQRIRTGDQRKKIQFLVNISHELRTPLTLIYAPLKRLLNGLGDDDPSKECLTDIYHQARYMKDIINMVLDINKLDQGNFSVSKRSAHSIHGLKELSTPSSKNLRKTVSIWFPRGQSDRRSSVRRGKTPDRDFQSSRQCSEIQSCRITGSGPDPTERG